MTGVKSFKLENQQFTYIKKKTKNNYEPYKQTATTEYHIPDFGHVHTHAAGFKRFKKYQPLSLPKTVV